MIRIHNSETDEVIDREMTAEEFEQWELMQNDMLKEKTKLENEMKQKKALLEKLGIDEDEAKLLLK